MAISGISVGSNIGVGGNVSGHAGGGHAGSMGVSVGMSGEGDWAGQLSDASGGFWGGAWNAFTGHSSEMSFFGPIMGETPYGHGAQLGHAIGLLASTFTLMGGNPLSMYGMAKHGESLGTFSGSSGGLAGEAPGDFGPGGGPSDMDPEPSGPDTSPAPTTQPATGPMPTPYTETKEYLGAQENIRLMQDYIGKLGSDLAALDARKKALSPTRRLMAGRIPLVHTELGAPEPKALTPEGRERMLMAHPAPARRAA